VIVILIAEGKCLQYATKSIGKINLWETILLDFNDE